MGCLKLCLFMVLAFQLQLSSMMHERCRPRTIQLQDKRVEVCSGGRWGPVCGDSGWDNNAAKVVCRQLNQPFTGAEASRTNKSGMSVVLLRIVRCRGNEEELFTGRSKCFFRLRRSSNICFTNEVAAVECKENSVTTLLPTQTTEGTIRETSLLPTIQQTTDLWPITRQATDILQTTQQPTSQPTIVQQEETSPSSSRFRINISSEFISTTSTVTVTIQWGIMADRTSLYEVVCTTDRNGQQNNHIKIVMSQQKNQAELQGLRPNTMYSCCVHAQSVNQSTSSCSQLTTPGKEDGTVDSVTILGILLAMTGLLLVAIAIGWVITCVVVCRRRPGDQDIGSRSQEVSTKPGSDLNLENPCYQKNGLRTQPPDISAYDGVSLDDYSSVEPTYERLHADPGAGHTYDVITPSCAEPNGRGGFQNRSNKIQTDMSVEKSQVHSILDSRNNTMEDHSQHHYHILEEEKKQENDYYLLEKTNKAREDTDDHDYHILEDNSSSIMDLDKKWHTHNLTDRRKNSTHSHRGWLKDVGQSTTGVTMGTPQDYEMPIHTLKPREASKDLYSSHKH